MTLSNLAIILGITFVLLNVYGLINPAGFKSAAQSFPRSVGWGYLLMTVSTGWFLFNLSRESIADFDAYKRFMYLLFAVIAVGSCLYVRDYLATRGLALVLMLSAKLMVDTARWADSNWRLVIIVWAYVWVIAGIWLTVSPYRLRDWIAWATKDNGRIRTLSGLRVALGVLVAALGLLVFRQ